MKKNYGDDDGRSFADMSSLPVRTPFGSYRDRGTGTKRKKSDAEQAHAGGSVGREDRRSYMWGALSAALLTALAFIVGLGAVIALMVLFFS